MLCLILLRTEILFERNTFGHLSASRMQDCTLELCRHQYDDLTLVRAYRTALLSLLLFSRDWLNVVCVCCGERRRGQYDFTHTYHARNSVFAYSHTPCWTYGLTVRFIYLLFLFFLYISNLHIILHDFYRYMCNPPFYSSREDDSRSAEGKVLEPSSVCTGADVEMITPNGEETFVGEMVKESMKGVGEGVCKYWSWSSCFFSS